MPESGPRTLRWTRGEYYKVAATGLFEGRRVELIKGEIVEMTPQESRHATAVTLADDAVRLLFGSGPFVVRVQLPLALGTDSDPEPDVAVVPGVPRDYSGAHPSGALLTVEVADSSLEYDRSTKASLYAEAGIEEYWIVDLLHRQLIVHRQPLSGPVHAGSWRYESIEELPATAKVSPLAAPSTVVAVADLLP